MRCSTRGLQVAAAVPFLACRWRSPARLHLLPGCVLTGNLTFPFCPQCKDFFKAGRGIYEDFCRRLPFYPSDFTDGRLDLDL